MKWFKTRPLLQGIVWLMLCTLVLLLIDQWCYQLALPVDITVQGGSTSMLIGTTHISLGDIGVPATLHFDSSDPVVHEYQIDGTDSTNNFTLDANYLHRLATTPYYRFQSWMRDLDGTSRWRSVRVLTGEQMVRTINSPGDGATVTLPTTNDLHIDMQLQRPETPRAFMLVVHTATQGDATIHVTIDRNDRYIDVTQDGAGFTGRELAHVFFPADPWPFLAMVLSFIVRTLLWAIVILCVVLAGEVLLITLRVRALAILWPRVSLCPFWIALRRRIIRIIPDTDDSVDRFKRPSVKSTFIGYISAMWHGLTEALHPVALLFLVVSCVFVCWISRVEYSGEPHIFDASAYLFAAKMYAQGHFSLPLPPAANLFPGPFMVQFAGRWFSQYPPGTSLTLVPGVWLHVPWLIEPLCGTAALSGIGLIAARLYDRRVASIAVILGTLSPFYSYLAASYMSHAIALFYLVWGFWACLRFVQGGAHWNLALATLCFGMAALTRDLVGLLWVALGVIAVICIYWSQIRMYWKGWLLPAGWSFIIVTAFVVINFSLNLYLTHNPLLSARSLFFAGDRWGFGANIGFYGQHTLAAGLVNLDELLTILAIDLYGWPFYFTLAFIALPFVTLKAKRRDIVLLGCAAILMGAYVGYFYHGIYLGPRYFYETLPFLLILTARGIIVLAQLGKQVGQTMSDRWLERWYRHDVSAASQLRYRGSVLTWLVVLVLIACNLIYYLPRQISIYQHYTGLPQSEPLDLQAIYQPHLHSAIVVTGDIVIYQCVLFPLNDPLLHDSVIYALANTPAQFDELHSAFPGRTIYQLNVLTGGAVQYQEIMGP